MSVLVDRAYERGIGAPPRRVRGWLLLASLFGATALALWVPGGFRPLDLREQVVLGSLSMTFLSMAALCVVLATSDGHQGVSRWRIGPWYLLWGGLAFGVAPLTWLLPQTGSASRIALGSVVTALVLFGLAIVAWTAGYCVGAPSVLGHLSSRGYSLLLRGTTPVIRGGTMPWVLYGVGTVARLLTVALTGRFGYLGDPSPLVRYAGPFDHMLRLLATLSLFAIAAAAYRAFSDVTRGSKLTLWSLVGLEAVVGALAGGKQYFLLSVLAVLIPYGALRGRLSLRILLAGAVVFLGVAVPFNTAYRQVVRGEDSTLSPAAAVAAAPRVFSEVIAADSIPSLMATSSIQILQRVRMIDSVAITAQLTPETIPYRSPTEFLSAPLVGMVPRLLWPDKPILTTGYEFSRTYYGTSSDMYTSVGITALGDLYQHGGAPIIVIGMLLFGAGTRLLDALVRPERDPRAICFLLVFLPMLVRVDVYNMVVSIPSGLVLAAVGVRLICRTGRTVEAGS